MLLALLLAAAVAAGSSAPPSVHPPMRPTATTPTVTIAVVGDTILGSTPQLPADPAHYLDPVRKPLAAQITFGNLEGTLTTATHSKCSPGSSQCFAFRNPPGYATYFRAAGFDVMNSANNHSHDFGDRGVTQTSRALAAHDIAQSGLPGQIAVVKAAGIKVAFVGFAPYPDVSNLLNLPAAAKLIRKAVTMADVVVVYMHAGAEGADKQHVTGKEEYFLGEDRGNPRKFAHMAVNNGADLVVASGPHVLRGMEFYRHRLVAYSLANFASYHNFNTDGVLALSGVLRITLGSKGGFRSARLLSAKLSGIGRAKRDYSAASAHLVARLSKEDFDAHAARVLEHGEILPPPAA
jgi:poly-gamma-glutamate capsule biosynthesis protein CapA/YwtB (metallophosphatase superfamily)